MSFTIRALAAGDRDRWEVLWQGYMDFYENVVPAEVTETTWRRLMTPGEDPQGLCAVDEAGRLLGIVHFHFHRTTWTVGDYCYLQDLFTAEEARGQGVGAALIEAVNKIARERGASCVYWLTQDYNATARRLYDKVATVTPFIKYVQKF